MLENNSETAEEVHMRFRNPHIYILYIHVIKSTCKLLILYILAFQLKNKEKKSYVSTNRQIILIL